MLGTAARACGVLLDLITPCLDQIEQRKQHQALPKFVGRDLLGLRSESTEQPVVILQHEIVLIGPVIMSALCQNLDLVEMPRPQLNERGALGVAWFMFHGVGLCCHKYE